MLYYADLQKKNISSLSKNNLCTFPNAPRPIILINLNCDNLTTIHLSLLAYFGNINAVVPFSSWSAERPLLPPRAFEINPEKNLILTNYKVYKKVNV